MNRIVYLLLAASVLPASQSNAQLLRSLGAKVAVTSASQKFDYAYSPFPGFRQDKKRRTGVNAAIFAEWLNTPFISIVTQLEYAQRGFTETIAPVASSPGIAVMDTRDNRVDYLSLPILLKASLSLGVFSPYVIVGPRLDKYLGYHDNFIVPNSINEEFTKTLWGGSAGIGLELRTLLPVSLSIEFRYNADFADSYKDYLLRVRNDAYDFWLGVAL